MRAIAYYRTRHIDPKASERAILEQRNIVAAWAASHPDHEVIGDFTENETDLGPRYILKSAIEDCKEQDAFLLIASTEAIGRGQPFHPRIFSVPVIKLPPFKRALGYIKSAPSDAPVGLSLYFDDHAEGRSSDIYLCNGSKYSIADVTASLVGTAANLDDLSPTTISGDSDVLVTSTETRRVQSLGAGQMSLISHYDAICDSDFLLICALTYRIEDAQEQKDRAVVGKAHSSGGFIRFFTA